MKIFLTSKKHLLAYGTLLFLALGTLIFTPKEALMTAGQAEDRLLPIYCVEKGEEKVCALTFDAAWGDEDTDKLIEILGKEEVPATFFMVGSWVEKYPQSVKKFFDAGHEIMNHSNTHPHINQLSEEKIRQEITLCADKIEAVTGVRPTLFRGPYGEYNNSVIKIAREEGHNVLQWDVDSLDWKDLPPEDIITRVTKRVKPGSVILFHNGAKNTPEALPVVIQKLKEAGYTFVKASDLLLEGETTIDSSGRQIPA